MMESALAASKPAILAVFLAFLGGCKITDDKVATDVAGENSGQDSGSVPTIWGDPQTSVLVGANYAFRPEAEDTDGDVLEFSIANKPSWASFDSNSGLIHGIPDQDDVGVDRNIVISVTDDNSVVSLASFNIRVESVATSDPGDDPDPDNGSSSAPPTISGTPNTSVVVGQSYVFRPDVDDPDSDSFSYSIVNRPRWLNFNTTTGRLHGTPTEENIGTSHPIEISVTDGTSIAALPRFQVTVEAVGMVSKTISWTPPRENEDGTPLTDLSGYRIYYGTESGEYTEVIELNSPGMTSYVIGNLTPGTYYLAMTSFNSMELESRRSGEISFTL